MHVRVTGRDLAAALKTVLTVIEKRNAIPALLCARIKTVGARLTIEGTDLDMSILTEIDIISGGDDFDVLVPASILAAAVKYAGPAPVDMTLFKEVKRRLKFKKERCLDEEEEYTIESLTVSIADGDAVFDIQLSSPVTDWPDTFSFQYIPSPYETFTNGHLKQMLDKVSVSISTEETRYYLNGIYWTPGVFVATDGHRLTRHRYQHTTEGDIKAIIPRKTVEVLKKFAGGDVKTQRYNVTKKDADAPPILGFHAGNVWIITKTIDGTFPDYERVIPKDDTLTTVFEFDAAQLAAAAKRVSTFFASHSKGRRAVTFTKDEEGNVMLSADALGEFNVKAKTFAKWPETDINRFGYNVSYLLAAITTEGNMKLAMQDSGSPAVITFDVEEDVTRVIMPMRV